MKSFCQHREISVAAGGQNNGIETISITFPTKARISHINSVTVKKKKKSSMSTHFPEFIELLPEVLWQQLGDLFHSFLKYEAINSITFAFLSVNI